MEERMMRQAMTDYVKDRQLQRENSVDEEMATLLVEAMKNLSDYAYTYVEKMQEKYSIDAGRSVNIEIGIDKGAEEQTRADAQKKASLQGKTIDMLYDLRMDTGCAIDATKKIIPMQPIGVRRGPAIATVKPAAHGYCYDCGCIVDSTQDFCPACGKAIDWDGVHHGRTRGMKRGIEVEQTWDRNGNYLMVVRKAKGKLTLEDIREAAMECEQDYYGLVIKAIDGDMDQYYDDDLCGDAAELYRMSDFLRAIERLKDR